MGGWGVIKAKDTLEEWIQTSQDRAVFWNWVHLLYGQMIIKAGVFMSWTDVGLYFPRIGYTTLLYLCMAFGSFWFGTWMTWKLLHNKKKNRTITLVYHTGPSFFGGDAEISYIKHQSQLPWIWLLLVLFLF